MKKKFKLNRYILLFSLALTILILFTLFFLKNIKLKKIVEEEPTDIAIVNVTTVEAHIYWKSSLDSIQKLQYKESLHTGIFRDVSNSYAYIDSITNKKVNVAKLSYLSPDTEYVFRIKSEDTIWDEGFSFKTKPIADEIKLPSIVTGQGEDRSFMLLDIEGDMYMVNTQYHGTWAFDSKGKEYTMRNYANYMSKTELAIRLNSILRSPVYAESGANCKTGIKIKDSSRPPSKAKTVDILNRWVASCKLGGYPDECYEDVYCRALKAGVDPAFAIAIWSHESGGSNYAYSSKVEDFGIHGLSSVPARDFDKQANHFLNNIAAKASSYISGCSGDSLDAWGAKFLTGSCTSSTNLAKGKTYMTAISEVYSWYTNKPLKWPFTVSPNSSACDYSSAKTNTIYNSCTSKGTSSSTSSTSPTSSSTKSSSTPKDGDGIKDYMIVTGDGVTSKDRACKDPDGCICLYGYSNSNADHTITIKYGYTCTVDRKVIKTPSATKVCCNTNGKLTFVLQSNCKGTVIKNVTEANCKKVCCLTNDKPTYVMPKDCKGTQLKNVSEANCKKVCCSTNNTLSYVMVKNCKGTIQRDVSEADCRKVCCLTNDRVSYVLLKNCKGEVKDGVDEENCKKVCCLKDDSLSYILKTECEGSIVEGVDETSCKAQESTLDIKSGINFIEAPFIINQQQVPIPSAKALIQFSEDKIIAVGLFRNDRWEKIVQSENGIINGEDFNIEPGESYLVIATSAISIPISTITSRYSIDLSQLIGWNLVPGSAFERVRLESKSILQSSNYTYINQIAKWNDELSLFNYTLKEENDQIIGDNLYMDNQESFFIRIPK